MKSGFQIARIFGVSIQVDWSWLLIFLLVAWNLAGGVFPGMHPNWSPALSIAIGITAALLFFASVLAHELAHTLVAKASGLPVRRIVLFMFGGVSNIEREPSSPGNEFLIAIVGPVTSLLLGVLFLFLGGANLRQLGIAAQNPMQALSSLDPLSSLLLWLGPVNILVGLFNLIPGFPLDGGRVLRSILWAATNNLHKATRWAAWIGQGIAWLFILAGVAMAFGLRVPVLGTGLISGLWLAFIGWFLNSAASQSYQQVVVQDLLEGVPVSRLMRSDIQRVSPELEVDNLVYEQIMGTEERAFPVVEDDRLVGLVSLEDVRKAPRDEWPRLKVADIMTPAAQLDTATPREDMTQALEKFANRDVRQLPVVENGHLLGVLRRRDIVRWLQLHSDGGANKPLAG